MLCAARSHLPLCFICIFVNILVHDNDIVRAEFGHAWLPKRMGSAGGSLAGHEGTLGWQARRLPRGSKAAAPVKGAAAKATNAKATAPAQGAVLHAMKATHSFCQGGSRASHECKCSYARATAPAQGAILQAMKATHIFCQGGSRASHECKCSYARATAPAQGAVLQAMKATHSFCQGGSRASHQGKCSYTRMQPRLPRGQSCIGHESAPP
jgi:hypothetical protein